MCVVFISGHIMTLRKLTGGKRMCNFFLLDVLVARA